MSPRNPDARRNQPWTKRVDERGLPGRVGYFRGGQWADLEAGARAAGYVMTKRIRGVPTEVPDVVSYIMHLHSRDKGTLS